MSLSHHTYRLWNEPPPDGAPSPAGDAWVRQTLRDDQRDPLAMSEMRRIAIRCGMGPDLSGVSDHEVVDRMAGFIASGTVRLFIEPVSLGSGGGGGVAPPPPAPKPTPPKPAPPKPAPPAKKLANLHVQLQHPCDKSPLDKGTVHISGPETHDLNTGADGWAKFDGIAPGSYSIRGQHPQHKEGTATANAPADATTESKLPLQATIEIKAVKTEYTVVLDKTGNLPSAGTFPILEFTITKGPPNHLFDVQISRAGAGKLSGGPGLGDSWAPGDARDVRVGRTEYSSWSSGQKTLKLDGAGSATFKMPIEWWRDQARRTLATFTEDTLAFRVVAVKDAATPICADSAKGSLKLRNNLTKFDVVDLGYIAGGTKHSVRMEFTVREADTTEMYTMVQWMQGAMPQWSGTPPVKSFPTHKLYDIIHDADFPDFTIDRLHTNPRYRDGAFTVSADKKTASTDDAPGGAIDPGISHEWHGVDFETRVHLNFEVPAAVKITRKDGSAPVFGVVTGKLDDPQPVTLTSKTWNTRVLQVRNADGTITVTHPASFAGP
ncbi:hypothetical protein J421_3892 [Gemmatirosa kalamazoonensis]|uniref:Uncharacterized protein n=1 Tax=Gemmatirosa kalamazoonensis TaxID=861299 RepID=W0RK05_9BACT|nr:hypothetical protein [Gemmatirosa kalamazoonensis]AHG91429.1 hypothetical protein J421_3892 [Gemmatirosa kalamazoonensis]